jgi:hypothetical protein
MPSKHKQRYGRSKFAPYEPGDEAIGTWPREQLERMNARFVERMLLAIERGLERSPDGEAPERAA